MTILITSFFRVIRDFFTFVAPYIIAGIEEGVELTRDEIARCRRALIIVTILLIGTPVIAILLTSLLPWMWIKNLILYIMVISLTGSVLFFSWRFFNLVSIVGLVFNPAGGKGVSGRWGKTVEKTLKFILGILAWEATLNLYAMIIPIHRAPSIFLIFMTATFILAMGSYAWGVGTKRGKRFVLGAVITIMAAATLFLLFPSVGRSIQYQFFSPMGLEMKESSWDYLQGLEKQDADWYRDQLSQLARDRQLYGRTPEIQQREKDLWAWKEGRLEEYKALRPGVELPKMEGAKKINTSSFYFWFLLAVGVLLIFSLVRRRWGLTVVVIIVLLMVMGIRMGKGGGEVVWAQVQSQGPGQVTYRVGRALPNPFFCLTLDSLKVTDDYTFCYLTWLRSHPQPEAASFSGETYLTDNRGKHLILGGLNLELWGKHELPLGKRFSAVGIFPAVNKGEKISFFVSDLWNHQWSLKNIQL